MVLPALCFGLVCLGLVCLCLGQANFMVGAVFREGDPVEGGIWLWFTETRPQKGQHEGCWASLSRSRWNIPCLGQGRWIFIRSDSRTRHAYGVLRGKYPLFTLMLCCVWPSFTLARGSAIWGHVIFTFSHSLQLLPLHARFKCTFKTLTASVSPAFSILLVCQIPNLNPSSTVQYGRLRRQGGGAKYPQEQADGGEWFTHILEAVSYTFTACGVWESRPIGHCCSCFGSANLRPVPAPSPWGGSWGLWSHFYWLRNEQEMY